MTGALKERTRFIHLRSKSVCIIQNFEVFLLLNFTFAPPEVTLPNGNALSKEPRNSTKRTVFAQFTERVCQISVRLWFSFVFVCWAPNKTSRFVFISHTSFTCERIENYAQIMGFCLATQIKIWKRVLDRTRSVYKRRGCRKSSVQWKCDFGFWTVAWHTDPLLSSTS